jgi:hypothetical protein
LSDGPYQAAGHSEQAKTVGNVSAYTAALLFQGIEQKAHGQHVRFIQQQMIPERAIEGHHMIKRNGRTDHYRRFGCHSFRSPEGEVTTRTTKTRSPTPGYRFDVEPDRNDLAQECVPRLRIP